MMALKNYRTEVDAAQTVQEISRRLARHGAAEIATEYQKTEPVGLRFIAETAHGPQQFRLPAQWQSVQRVLQGQYDRGIEGVARRHTSERQARRVAWRLVANWIDVQLALIEVGMVTLDEALLAYLVLPESGQTLYAAITERGLPYLDRRPSAGNVILLPARVGGE